MLNFAELAKKTDARPSASTGHVPWGPRQYLLKQNKASSLWMARISRKIHSRIEANIWPMLKTTPRCLCWAIGTRPVDACLIRSPPFAERLLGAQNWHQGILLKILGSLMTQNKTDKFRFYGPKQTVKFVSCLIMQIANGWCGGGFEFQARTHTEAHKTTIGHRQFLTWSGLWGPESPRQMSPVGRTRASDWKTKRQTYVIGLANRSPPPIAIRAQIAKITQHLYKYNNVVRGDSKKNTDSLVSWCMHLLSYKVPSITRFTPALWVHVHLTSMWCIENPSRLLVPMSN